MKEGGEAWYKRVDISIDIYVYLYKNSIPAFLYLNLGESWSPAPVARPVIHTVIHIQVEEGGLGLKR